MTEQPAQGPDRQPTDPHPWEWQKPLMRKAARYRPPTVKMLLTDQIRRRFGYHLDI